MRRGEVRFYLGPNWRKIRKIIRRGKRKIGKFNDIHYKRTGRGLEFKRQLDRFMH